MKALTHRLAGGLLSGVLLLSTGCTTLAPAAREPWAGADTVGNLDDSMIIGRWALTLLNPLPGQETQTTRFIYASDGTVRGTLNTSGANEAGSTSSSSGELSFELAGTWRTEGEWLIHSAVSMVSRDDSLAGLAMSRMFNEQAVAGKANVFEVSANRLVMVGDDGQAIRYDRLE